MVLGAGSWGTALAMVLARNDHRVTLWGRDAEQIQAMASSRRNQRYLPDLELPDNVRVTDDLASALAGIHAILIATPTQAFRQILQQLAQLGAAQLPLIWACKGLEHGSGKLLHQVAMEVFGSQAQLAVISGPTFATEIARGLPAAVTVAANHSDYCLQAASWFHGDHLRAYTSQDLIGVQLGGALKNVLAIAAGIADGLALGANSRAALITRGLAELMRLGDAMGGQRETFMGLAGLGDLVLTCTDNLSRNRRMGLALAAGTSLDEARAQIGQAVEGVKTAEEAWRLAQTYQVAMPITEQVQHVIAGQTSPRDAVMNLWQRDLKAELR